MPQNAPRLATCAGAPHPRPLPGGPRAETDDGAQGVVDPARLRRLPGRGEEGVQGRHSPGRTVGLGGLDRARPRRDRPPVRRDRRGRGPDRRHRLRPVRPDARGDRAARSVAIGDRGRAGPTRRRGGRGEARLTGGRGSG